MKVPNWRFSRTKELISCPGQAGKAPRGLGGDAVPGGAPAGLGSASKQMGAKATMQPGHQDRGVSRQLTRPGAAEDSGFPSLTPAQNRFTRRKCPNSAQLRPSCLCRTCSHGDDGVLQWPAQLLACSPPPRPPKSLFVWHSNMLRCRHSQLHVPEPTLPLRAVLREM